MPNFYTYLICTLPNLQFWMKPPVSVEKFLKMCERLIPDEDVELLKSLVTKGAEDRFNKWFEFDAALRNELGKVRASRRHIDPAKYLRKDGCAETYISH